MTLTEKVLHLYDHGVDSLNALAKATEISKQTVRRILITNGRWTSDTSEISERVGISYKMVIAYLPYPKGPRKDWPDTLNAQRIRATREKKKHQDNT
jgi:hypothetical protein